MIQRSYPEYFRNCKTNWFQACQQKSEFCRNMKEIMMSIYSTVWLVIMWLNFVNFLVASSDLFVRLVYFELIGKLIRWFHINVNFCVSSVLIRVSVLGIRRNFRKRNICFVIFDRVGCLRRRLVGLGWENVRFWEDMAWSWEVGDIISSIWGLYIWIFVRFWEDIVSSGNVDGINLANWGLFLWLFGYLGVCCEF